MTVFRDTIKSPNSDAPSLIEIAMGIVDNGSELFEIVKKCCSQGRVQDADNLVEKADAVLGHLETLFVKLGISKEGVELNNIKKD